MSNKKGVSFDDTGVAFQSKSPGELRRTYLLFWLMNNNFLVKTGTSIIKFGLSSRLPIKGIIKRTLFKQFCGGETIEECKKVINDLYKFRIGTVLDYSVEGEDDEASFDKTKDEILKTIEIAAGNPSIPFCVFKVTGIGSSELLAKVQRKENLSNSEAEAFNKIRLRVESLCAASYNQNVRILVDAEETWIQGTIDDLAYQMMKKYNKRRTIVFNTFQMYRKDMLDNLKSAYFTANEQGYFLGVKLVRGAYMEKERMVAANKGTDSPIQNSKLDSDNDFNKGLVFCLEHIDKIELCCGSHNEESNYLLMDLMKKNNIEKNDSRIFFVQLYGMSDHISFNLSNAGYNVGKYVPYGPVESVMPYLFRRANENTSISGQSSREFNLISKEVERRTRG